jgi:hypothetical protein
MVAAKMTTDRKEIQKWVEARGGRPARVKQTGRGRDPGILRIDYPGFSGEETLETISWNEWFDAFDKNQLAMLYQSGPRSRFSKLVTRDKAATPRRAVAAKRTTAKRTARRGTGVARTATKAAATTSRKTPRAAAARTSKRPTATKKRTAPKKRATAKKRSAKK